MATTQARPEPTDPSPDPDTDPDTDPNPYPDPGPHPGPNPAQPWPKLRPRYHAGPLGHISSEGCEFCVGIRSALICGDTVSLYAGAGLVAGSVARHELDETQADTEGLRMR